MARRRSDGGAGRARGGRGGANGNGRAHAERPRPARPGRGEGAVAPRGTLISIGGHEDKKCDRLILRDVARRVGGGKLVVLTAASAVPREVFETYEPIFRGLGVRSVHHLHVDDRAQAKEESRVRILDDAHGVFIAGGDQLKLTSQLGDSPIYTRMRDIYMAGGVIAGTSAGASVVCETMMVGGDGERSHRIRGALQLAPGFGFIPGVIIDQHFAERGRSGRLVAAVVQNPRILGIGIDEDTAIVTDARRGRFRVLGSGAVHVVDGADVTYSNLSDEESDRTLSAFGLRIHLLSMGDEFDLESRTPASHRAREIEEEIREAAGR